jgi:hypothetical protein
MTNEDSSDLWWLGNGFQSLGVGAGRFRSGLTVRKASVTFEDGVVGRANFVEETQGVLPQRQGVSERTKHSASSGEP